MFIYNNNRWETILIEAIICSIIVMSSNKKYHQELNISYSYRYSINLLQLFCEMMEYQEHYKVIQRNHYLRVDQIAACDGLKQYHLIDRSIVITNRLH